MVPRKPTGNSKRGVKNVSKANILKGKYEAKLAHGVSNQSTHPPHPPYEERNGYFLEHLKALLIGTNLHSFIERHTCKPNKSLGPINATFYFGDRASRDNKILNNQKTNLLRQILNILPVKYFNFVPKSES